MTPHIKLLEDKICEILKPTKKELSHGLETKEWLLRLYPNSTWEVQIAALAHDIERAVPDIPNMTPPKINKLKDEDYEIWKKRHAIRSAIIVKHLMKVYLFDDDEICRVINAISEHDDAGGTTNKDAVAVRDADSVRFFDKGILNYSTAFGLESAKTKALYMYKRSSKKAKRAIDSLDYNVEVKKHIKENKQS